MAELAAPGADAEFHYGSAAHQADTAIAGMWLFLATEILFFGGLVFAWTVLAMTHPDGVRLAVGHTNLLIGTVNTALLLTSSAVCTWAVARPEDTRRVVRGFLFTGLLGAAFLVLKSVEWLGEFHEHLFPGPGFALSGFALGGFAAGATAGGGAQLFYSLYFIATGLHGIHMLVGLALLAITAWRARRNGFRPGHTTPVEVTALYWSFVDLVWLVLYPLIYLVMRP